MGGASLLGAAMQTQLGSRYFWGHKFDHTCCATKVGVSQQASVGQIQLSFVGLALLSFALLNSIFIL